VNFADEADFAASAPARAAGRWFAPTVALACAVVTGCQRPAREVVPVATAMPVAAPKVAPVETGPEAVTWERLDLGMEPDSVYEPWMLTTRVKVLEGKTVRITGFMSGAILQKSNIRTFPLMREKECPFGVGGQAHHVVEVELAGSLRTEFTTEPVTIEGVFCVKPWTGPNGKTWSLYRLDGARVKG
jgi:hypothetical protein